MKTTNQTFHISLLMGLPASGKSYWAEHNFEKNTFYHTGRFIVDLDKYMHESSGNLTDSIIMKALNKSDLKSYTGGLFGSRKDVFCCVDGLITDIDSLTKVIDTTLEYIKNRCSGSYDVKLYIHQWNEDRDTCIYNDSIRVKANERTVSSATTIRTHKYEYIQKDQLLKYRRLGYVSAIKFERHKVKKLTNYDINFVPRIERDRNECYGGHYYNEKGPEFTKYMYSDDWSGGGDWASWDDSSGTISPENPKDFDKLDEFLEKICPNLTFLQYKKIKRTCVDIEETNEYDYYGGCEKHFRWRCDLEKLYEILKEMNLIDDYTFISSRI